MWSWKAWYTRTQCNKVYKILLSRDFVLIWPCMHGLLSCLAKTPFLSIKSLKTRHRIKNFYFHEFGDSDCNQILLCRSPSILPTTHTHLQSSGKTETSFLQPFSENVCNNDVNYKSRNHKVDLGPRGNYNTLPKFLLFN